MAQSRNSWADIKVTQFSRFLFAIWSWASNSIRSRITLPKLAAIKCCLSERFIQFWSECTFSAEWSSCNRIQSTKTRRLKWTEWLQRGRKKKVIYNIYSSAAPTEIKRTTTDVFPFPADVTEALFQPAASFLHLFPVALLLILIFNWRRVRLDPFSCFLPSLAPLVPQSVSLSDCSKDQPPRKLQNPLLVSSALFFPLLAHCFLNIFVRSTTHFHLQTKTPRIAEMAPKSSRRRKICHSFIYVMKWRGKPSSSAAYVCRVSLHCQPAPIPDRTFPQFLCLKICWSVNFIRIGTWNTVGQPEERKKVMF